MTGSPVQVGHEIELKPLLRERLALGCETQAGPGDPCELATRLWAGLLAEGDVVRCGRRAFFPWGGFYVELGQLVELMTTPTGSVQGITDALGIVCRRARRAAERAFPIDGGESLWALHCVNDDLSAPPPALSPGIRSSNGTGFHVNVTVRGERDHEATREFLSYVTALLTAMTGAGGFVRHPAEGLLFLRDPRVAHVTALTPRELQRGKPMVKIGGEFGRHQLLGAGFTPATADQEIRSTCYMAAGLAARRAAPTRRLAEVPPLTSSGRIKALDGDRPVKLAPLDAFEQLLLDTVAPLLDTDEGILAGIDRGFELGLRAVSALRRLESWEVAAEVPLGWAIQCAAFQPLCDEIDVPFPDGDSPVAHAFLDDLAVVSARASSLVDADEVHAFLHQAAKLPWPAEEVWWTRATAISESPDSPGDAAWELHALAHEKETAITWETVNRPQGFWFGKLLDGRLEEMMR